MHSEILIPMTVHVVWVAILYALLTICRAPKVWGVGANTDHSDPFEEIEIRICANLSNQFEWPIFFYVICLLVIFTDLYSKQLYVWLAWLFVVGRLLHTFVHICTSNVRARGLVFTINFSAVLIMWCMFLFEKTQNY